MNIDERLAALTARHEALTLTVEVMSGMMKDLLKAHEENEHWVVLLTKLVARHDQILDKGDEV